MCSGSSDSSAEGENSPQRSRFSFLAKSGCAAILSGAVVTVLFVIVNSQQDAEEELDLNASAGFTAGPEARPVAARTAGYVGSDSCQKCHEHQHATWHNSYHRTMTQVASPESIVGDFGGSELELNGKSYRIGRDKDQFWVEFEKAVPGEQGAVESLRRQVVLCTGSHHMQIYWLSTGRGRQLAIFPFLWLIPEQRWIPRGMAFLIPPVDASDAHLATSDQSLFEFGRWNETCATCHTTRPQPHLDDEEIPTRVAEFGIACEACHGPGEAHVQFRRGAASELASDRIVNPSSLTHQRSSEVCGQCHSVQKYEIGGDFHMAQMTSGSTYRPGDNLGEKLQIRADGNNTDQFWSDGMVRVTGREFNGLIESPCYQRGKLSCFSCHQMHPADDDPRPRKDWADDQLKPRMRGDEACLQCHSEFRSEDRIAAHTHHAPMSQGSACYNCHMPNTTYGVLKATRSHTVSSPSVKETLANRRPNACNLCHLNKTLKWTAGFLADWYGHPTPPMSDDLKNVALSVNLALSGDAGQRALIAWHMGWEPARKASSEHWLPPYLALLMNDNYDAVRFIAQRSLKQIGGYDDVEFDFVASSSERARPCGEIRDRWSQRMIAAPAFAPDPSVLITGRGTLDSAAFDKLLGVRNQVKIYLEE